MPYIEPLANPIYCSLHTFGEVDIALSVHEPVMSCEPLEKRMEIQPPHTHKSHLGANVTVLTHRSALLPCFHQAITQKRASIKRIALFIRAL